MRLRFPCARLALMLGGALVLAQSAAATEPGSARHRELVHLVRQDCGSCHGPAAINAGGAPDLRRSPLLDNLDAVLFDGVLTGAGMPAFSKYLRRDEAEDLKAYLFDRAGR